MPRYLLSVWHDEPYDDVVDTSTGPQRSISKVNEFNAALEAAGAWVFGTGLLPATSATAVRSDGGDVSMTDGPYAETKEQVGGFWVIEAADFDAALDWAVQAAAASNDRSRSARPTMRDSLADVFHREAGRCTATLIRVLGDVDLAEDAVAEGAEPRLPHSTGSW